MNHGQNAQYWLVWDDFLMGGYVVKAGEYQMTSARDEDEAERFVKTVLSASPCRSYRYEIR